MGRHWGEISRLDGQCLGELLESVPGLGWPGGHIALGLFTPIFRKGDGDMAISSHKGNRVSKRDGILPAAPQPGVEVGMKGLGSAASLSSRVGTAAQGGQLFLPSPSLLPAGCVCLCHRLSIERMLPSLPLGFRFQI